MSTTSAEERLYQLQRENLEAFERRTSEKFDKIFDWQTETGRCLERMGAEIKRVDSEIAEHRKTEGGGGGHHRMDAATAFLGKHWLKLVIGGALTSSITTHPGVHSILTSSVG